MLFWISEHHYYGDGYDPRTGFVYEFYGCFYHRCPECFPQRHQRHAKLDGATPHELYTRTVQRAERIRQGGHVVVEKWECEWEAQKREDPELRLWAKTLDLVTPWIPARPSSADGPKQSEPTVRPSRTNTSSTTISRRCTRGSSRHSHAVYLPDP